MDRGSGEELAALAHEAGADVLEGTLTDPSETGYWQLGDTDLSEYLAGYRDQRLALIIATVGAAEPEMRTAISR